MSDYPVEINSVIPIVKVSSMDVNGANIDEVKRKADNGDADAQLALGIHLIRTNGPGRAATTGVELLERAANVGNVKANLMVGNVFYSGYFVETDYVKASKFLGRAAEAGDGSSQMLLAKILDGGLMGSKQPQEALFWYRKAAENGIVAAQTVLGNKLRVSVATPEELKESIFWLNKAANAGDKMAQLRLGQIFESGGADTNEKVLAVFWYSVANLKGVKMVSPSKVDKLRVTLTAQELREVDELLAKYAREH